MGWHFLAAPASLSPGDAFGQHPGTFSFGGFRSEVQRRFAALDVAVLGFAARLRNGR
jgi:hypothetical protein